MLRRINIWKKLFVNSQQFLLRGSWNHSLRCTHWERWAVCSYHSATEKGEGRWVDLVKHGGNVGLTSQLLTIRHKIHLWIFDRFWKYTLFLTDVLSRDWIERLAWQSCCRGLYHCKKQRYMGVAQPPSPPPPPPFHSSEPREHCPGVLCEVLWLVIETTKLCMLISV